MKQRTRQTAFIISAIFVMFVIVSGCKRPPSPAGTPGHAVTRVSTLQCIQTGIASWYGKHMKGKKTASGEKYDPKLLTAASRKFPLGTELSVTNLNNDRNVTVTVNDRGPYSGRRIIDMSVAAAQKLDMKKSGLAPVCVQNTEQTGAQVDSSKQ